MIGSMTALRCSIAVVAAGSLGLACGTESQRPVAESSLTVAPPGDQPQVWSEVGAEILASRQSLDPSELSRSFLPVQSDPISITGDGNYDIVVTTSSPNCSPKASFRRSASRRGSRTTSSSRSEPSRSAPTGARSRSPFRCRASARRTRTSRSGCTESGGLGAADAPSRSARSRARGHDERVGEYDAVV